MTRSIPTSPQIGQGVTLWTDVTGAFFLRLDTVDNATGKLQTRLYNVQSGIETKPGSTMAPVNSVTTTLVTQNLYQLVKTLPYNMGMLGDLLIHYIIYDIISTSYFVVWIDITKGAVLPPQFYPSWTDVVLVMDTYSRQRVQAPAHLSLTTTAESELIAANPAAYNDLHSLTIANAGTTDALVHLRSATAGAIRLSVAIKVGNTQHLDFASGQLKQEAINSAWTAQSNAAPDVHISAVYGTSA